MLEPAAVIGGIALRALPGRGVTHGGGAGRAGRLHDQLVLELRADACPKLDAQLLGHRVARRPKRDLAKEERRHEGDRDEHGADKEHLRDRGRDRPAQDRRDLGRDLLCLRAKRG